MIEYVMLFIFMLIQIFTFMIIIFLRKNDKTLIGEKGDSGALGKKGEDGEPGENLDANSTSSNAIIIKGERGEKGNKGFRGYSLWDSHCIINNIGCNNILSNNTEDN